MRFKVYRSLDKPSVLFGIKGAYFFLLLVLAGIGAVVSLIVGAFTVSYVGTGMFFLSVAIAYGVTMYVQGRMTVREFKRFLAARDLPRMLVLRSTRSLFEYNDDKGIK